MYELRIISGLHRGATLPLDGQPQLIGASEGADVVLVDACINERHATLSRTDTGWILTSESGEIFSAENNNTQSLIDLAPGDFFRLGDVWMMVVEEDAEWVKAPPVPTEELFNAFEDQMPREAEVQFTSSRRIDAGETVTQRDDNAVENDAEPAREWSGRRLMLIPVAAMVVLSAAAAYALTARNPTENLQQNRDLKSSDAIATSVAQQTAFAPHKRDAKSTHRAPVTVARTLSQKELQKAFRKRLIDADLITRFEINLQNKSWKMQADLNEEETKRFERILQTFMREHNITFPVSAKIVNAEKMLPFKIRQVITGANASVITQDGDRLYVGEEYRGVRVVAIQENRLVFAGKQKIEMPW